MHKRAALVSALVLFCVVCVLPKSRKDVPLAPVPAKIAGAKTAFLVNGGGMDLAYDALYSSMKQWGRFELVDSAEKADVVIEIRYTEQDGGTRVWSSTNTYTKQTQVHSAHITDPQLILTVYDPASKDALWSTVEHRRLARREKNREKETVNAAQKLVDNLKARMQ